MKWALWTLVAAVGVIGVIAAIGMLLPVAHQESRSADFSTPPEAVFVLVSDVDAYRSWWAGATVKSEVVTRVPPSTLVTRVVGETQFGGTWTFEIVPTASGSRMTITERGEIYNVIFRALSRFVFGYASTMESCLAAAQKKLGSS